LLQVFSWGGFLVGLVVGAALGPAIVNLFNPKTPTGKALVGLGSFLGIAFVVEGLVAALGLVVRKKITNTKIARIDQIAGVAIAALLSLVSSWLIGVTLKNGPSPQVAKAMRGSAILKGIDSVAPRPPAVLAEVQRFLDRTGFPDVFAELNPSLAPGVEPAPASLRNDKEILAAAALTYKIESPGCGGVIDGSGFPVGRNLLVTAAHVVAGTRGPHSIIPPSGPAVRGEVVYIDTDRDIAILRGTMPGGIVEVSRQPAKPKETTGASIGYPGGGPRRISPARVRARTNAVGRDIYSRKLVSRTIYVLNSKVQRGMSGGPFVDDKDGRVRGMVFAASQSDPNESYALAENVINGAVNSARNRTKSVSTGGCAL
jgi:trypsin-like peptidase/colicin V production protein